MTRIPEKSINLYEPHQAQLWDLAFEKVLRETDESHNDGTAFAVICAAYLDTTVDEFTEQKDAKVPNQVLDEQILEVLRTAEEPALSIGMVQDRVDCQCGKNRAKDRLEHYVGKGLVEKTKIGSTPSYFVAG